MQQSLFVNLSTKIFLNNTYKILFIVPHRPGRSPGQRFRFEQYLDFLEQNNFKYEISHIIDEKDDAVFYNKGKYLQKFSILLKSIKCRLNDVKRAGDFDIIFIYRDALMIGSTFFEKQFKKSNAKIILDFDDAIWLPDVSQGNASLRWLKRPSKTETIIRLSDFVFVGNNFLADYAKRYNPNVKVIYTTIDTDYYQKRIISKPAGKICIGWTGSTTTMKHLELAVPFLKKIKAKYGEQVYFKVISDVPFKNNELEFEYCRWNKDSEIEDLNYFDIGIMPLPDDEWSKGKCGFKGLQYMALEIPAVMSNIGMNTEIIQNSVNGFIAANDEEWIAKLSLLIESKELREKLGKAGRKTVEEKYSFESQKQKYLNYFREVIES